MIDLLNAKKEFKKYIGNYNLANSEIERKVGHSYRVAEKSEKIARSLNLTNEEIELATLIGLLHDIGRFEQKTKYETYNDTCSIDHGKLGVEILEKNSYIRNYIKNDKYDNIIKTSIYNHNKYEIEKGLDDKNLIFCKIIRDSDKLDIFYEAIEIFWEKKVKITDDVTKKVFEDFKVGKQILNQDKKTQLDKVISIISFIFDINYLESFKIIKDNDYINKIMNKFEIEDKYVKEQFEEVQSIANNYVEDRIKNMK